MEEDIRWEWSGGRWVLASSVTSLLKSMARKSLEKKEKETSGKGKRKKRIK